MDGTSKQAALGHGGLRTSHILGGFSENQSGIILPQKRKKLLCTLGHAHGCKVSFFCRILDELHDLIGQRNLGREIPSVVRHIVQSLLHHLSQILRQNFGGFCLINGRSRLTGLRNLRKLAVQLVVDDLLVKTGVKHGGGSFCYLIGFIILQNRCFVNQTSICSNQALQPLGKKIVPLKNPCYNHPIKLM